MKYLRLVHPILVSALVLCFGFGLAQEDAEALKIAKSVVGQFDDLVSRQDAVAMGQLFTKDAKLFAEGGHLEGREAIQEFQRESFQGGFAESSSSVSEAWLLGDTAFAIGTFTGNDGQSGGNNSLVLKRTDGTWRIYRLMYTGEGVPEDAASGGAVSGGGD